MKQIERELENAVSGYCARLGNYRGWTGYMARAEAGLVASSPGHETGYAASARAKDEARATMQDRLREIVQLWEGAA